MLGPTPLAARTADVADLSWALCDALDRSGESGGTHVDALLELLDRVGSDERVALCRAERALARGDAATALEILTAAWEAGAVAPRIEALLALTALALDLGQAAHALTERTDASLDHGLIRILVAVLTGEAIDVELGLSEAEVTWSLRGHLRTLAACGREDLVAEFAARATAVDAPALARAADGVPRAAAPDGGPVVPPLARARSFFEAVWPGPDPDVAFNWAWTAAREIGRGESVLLLSPSPAAFASLLAHARVVAVADYPARGADLVAAPGRLPFAPGRFQHVVAAWWLERGPEPHSVFEDLWRVTRHFGSLHLLGAATPSPNLDLCLASATLRTLLGVSRFAVEGVTTRKAYHLARAVKRIV